MRKAFRIFLLSLLLPFAAFAYNDGSTLYDCGNGGDFPMYFGGCRAGYYYEDWQNADSSITPEDVGECIECPIGYNCAGGFAGPAAASPCATGYYGETLASCAACTNKPAHSSYTAAAATNNCPWQCDDGYGKSGNSCVACGANQFSADGICQTAKFSITTTSDTTSLSWTMTAKGTFYVNCGDGGTLTQSGTTTGSTVSGNTITRTGTSGTTYTCTWPSSGAHIVRFAGMATGYFYDEEDEQASLWSSAIDFYTGTRTQIASLSGNLSSMFPYNWNDGREGAQPRFVQTFFGATNLTSVPDTLFADYTTGSTYMFNSTFYGCTGLQSLPSGLFSGITTAASSTFYQTFRGCTGLTSIPGNLFSGITTGANSMFYQTFLDCTGLTSIPGNLFSGITTGASNMFYGTFQGCTNLAGYIPPGTFAGLIAAGHPTASNMWYNTFYNTQLATSCPAGNPQYITGYEGTNASTTWNGKVSCGCEYGYWGDGTTCNTCTNTKPANASFYISTTATCPWACNDGYNNVNGSCVASGCAENELFDGTTCRDKKFSVTTTNDAASLSWTITAVGTFFADCVGGTLTQSTSSYGTISGKTITRTGTGATTYTCTWPSAGAHTVNFGGTATNYSTNISTAAISFYKSSGGTQAKIASVSGNLSSMFPYISGNATNGAQPRFYQTFYGATNLAEISNTLFSNYTTGANSMFYQTFLNCTGLTSIPGNLFSGITTGANSMFYQTFYGCTGLQTIPGTLFSGITTGVDYMFSGTFYGCTGLTSIPAELFSGITTGASNMFQSTFYGCTGLTSIPAELFSGITTAATGMFKSTFYNCTGLTSIPGNLFSGITTGADSMFYQTFRGCTGLQSIPGNLFSGITTGASSMFRQTFSGCTGLTSIPATLFSGITTGAGNMFNDTFSGCTGLQTIPGTLFSGITTGASYMFYNTFKGCTGLTSIPGNLFSGITTGAEGMFDSTFYGCTGLTSIPGNLFSGITTEAEGMFGNTFRGCTGLTSILGNLFSGITTGADSMFYGTFWGCTGLTSIPGNLFSGITTGENGMFQSTFQGCTGLTSIPGNLFSGITTGASSMFSSTFQGCTNLAGYIPPGTFAGLIAAGHPTAGYMWASTFANTNVATSCASYSGTTQYITGYEGSGSTTWDGRVSCKCDSGYYGDTSTGTGTCSACSNKPSNSTYTGNATTNACPWECDAGYYGSSANGDSSCTICPAGYACSGDVQTNCADSNGANGRPQYSVAGASSCTECPAVSGSLASRATGSYGYWRPNNIHDTQWGCWAIMIDDDPAGTYDILCYYDGGSTNYGGADSTCQIFASYVQGCAAGKYNTITSTTEWEEGAYARSNCGVDCMRGKVCTDTDPGYYSAAGDLTQTQCSAGTFSAGGAAACTTCTGATYSGAGASSCSACPAGYTYNTTSGKTLATQCQANCVAETYISDTIPTEYTQLEFIQSDGNQYINTGIRQYCNSDLTVEFSFKPTELGGWMLGNAYTQTNISAENGFEVGSVGVARVLYENGSEKIYYNDTLRWSSGWGCGYDNLPIMLFALGFDESGGIYEGNITNGAMYYVKIWNDNGELVRDFVPVRRNSDSVVGMYDNVTDAFFANAGTGNFTAGPDATSVCTNVGDGYWSAGGVVNFGSTSTRTACTNTKPTNSHYSGSAATNACPWACDTNYVEYANACHGFCPTNNTLHIGTLEYPVFADRTNVPSPVMNTIDSSGQICHIFFAPNGDNTTMALKVLYNDVVYRAIDPR